PGYVGYEEGGRLTEAVRRRPYAVILLDEMEKAHPRIFDLFLQVLEDGRLTDGKGRTVNFRNTVVLMTSNVGSQAIFEAGGKAEDAASEVQAALRTFFRPEFLNRIDEVVTFKALDKADMVSIAKIQMYKLETQLATKRIGLESSKEAASWLAENGFDPHYGARPLKRLIQQAVVNPMSRMVLDGQLKPGNLARLMTANGEIKIEAETVQ
ncbi:MAG: AAA family ATPase, partial [Holophagales bacterium]|nr:AAA family ATPase [Holophagales bacterium]